MRNSILTLMILVLVASIAYAGMAMPGTDGGELYKYITETSRYTNWELWPGKGKLYKGTEPHGVFLTTYVNAEAIKSLGMGKHVFMPGSIIAKENYSPKKQYMALTVMYKVKGYNPDAGDWFWVKYSPDGTVLKEGKVKGCIKCHSQAKDNDYNRTDAKAGKM
ncbi:hypothetical protein LCGC14_2315900 [marine sediment metagenome]|uniref:Cytochrome P460 domain-containing protein n=1 Tax=marine sediment metagenome TaxID=412755 RepID=A0A0F9CJU4_9ZZZZ